MNGDGFATCRNYDQRAKKGEVSSPPHPPRAHAVLLVHSRVGPIEARTNSIHMYVCCLHGVCRH